ncbi:MAG: hypothetical protein ABIJ97_03375 [Bacteroidota bacterium]
MYVIRKNYTGWLPDFRIAYQTIPDGTSLENLQKQNDAALHPD